MTADLVGCFGPNGRFFAVGGPLSGVFQAVTFTGRFEDVAVVGQAIQDGAGQALGSEDLGPLVEREVRCDDDTGPFVGGGDHVEEEFAAEFTGRDVAQFVEDQQVELGKLGFHPYQLAFLASFHQLRDQLGHAMKPNLFALATCGDAERRGQVCFASTGMADQDDRLSLFDILATHQFTKEHTINRRLRFELEVFERLVVREPCRFQTSIGRTLFTVE